MILLIVCLFGLISQSNALTIPAPALKEGQTLFITNNYEQNIRYWNSKKDGTVSISELRAFTYSEVSRLTGGKQKPITRQNNLDIDFTLY